MLWYRRGYGFKSCTSLNCFQALFSLLLKKHSLLWRFLSYSCIYLLLVCSGSETDVLTVYWLKGNLASRECVNNFFNSTVFLMSLDCIRCLRVLSNLELKRLLTILLFSVCSCFVFRAIIGWVLFLQQIKYEACDWKKNFLIEVALLKKQID